MKLKKFQRSLSVTSTWQHTKHIAALYPKLYPALFGINKGMGTNDISIFQFEETLAPSKFRHRVFAPQINFHPTIQPYIHVFEWISKKNFESGHYNDNRKKAPT